MKLTADKIRAVKKSAPLKEKEKEPETKANEESLKKIAERMGRGRPRKKEEEKAENRIVFYFNDAEIRDIEKAAEINGFSKADKNKYLKALIKKIVRAELQQFGRI